MREAREREKKREGRGSPARVPRSVTYEFRVIRWANSGGSCARGFARTRQGKSALEDSPRPAGRRGDQERIYEGMKEERTRGMVSRSETGRKRIKRAKRRGRADGRARGNKVEKVRARGVDF